METRSQPRRPRTGSTTPKTAFQPEIRQYAMTKRSQLSRADRRSKFVIGPWSFFRHLSSRWPSGHIGISHSPHNILPIFLQKHWVAWVAGIPLGVVEGVAVIGP